MKPCHDILSISLLCGPSYSDSYSPAWGGIVIISSLDPCRAQPSDPAPRPQDVQTFLRVLLKCQLSFSSTAGYILRFSLANKSGQYYWSMDHTFSRKVPVSLPESSLVPSTGSPRGPQRNLFEAKNGITSLPCLKYSASRQIHCQGSQQSKHWLQVLITWEAFKKSSAQGPV